MIEKYISAEDIYFLGLNREPTTSLAAIRNVIIKRNTSNSYNVEMAELKTKVEESMECPVRYKIVSLNIL